MHRDLKPENLMYIDGHCEIIQVIDFGFATTFEKGSKLTQRCGTIQYVAPEVLTGSGYDEKADVWSIGAVAYTLLTQKAMYSGDEKDVQRKNKLGEVDYSRTFKTVSKLAQDFVRTCLTVNPLRRPSAHDIFNAPWIKQYAAKAAAQAKRSHALYPACPIDVSETPEISLRLLRPKLDEPRLSRSTKAFKTPVPVQHASSSASTTASSSGRGSSYRPSRWHAGESKASGSPVSTIDGSGGRSSSASGSTDWTRHEGANRKASATTPTTTIEQSQRVLAEELQRGREETDCFAVVSEKVCLQLMHLFEQTRSSCMRVL